MNNLVDIISKLTYTMGKMEESAKEQFELSNLTLTQMNYLESISKLKNPNITELAAFLKLSKPTVKVAIDKLIDKDYVFKVLSDEDRRSSHLHLTEKGELINRMHDYAHLSIAGSFKEKLNNQEIKTLTELLNKVLS
jgi:DNA-binding MarR family transcriptional regulator